jgi:hypothetical protein
MNIREEAMFLKMEGKRSQVLAFLSKVGFDIFKSGPEIFIGNLGKNSAAPPI